MLRSYDGICGGDLDRSTGDGRLPVIERVLALTLLVGSLAGAAAPAPPGVEPQGGSDSQGFGVDCTFSHRAEDDPIVHPGHAGMAHSHDFIGNRRTDASSTYEDMVGNPSTCDRSGDDAAYWFPTLYNRGEPVDPGITLVYYRVGALRDREQIQPIPADLKVIAGNAGSTGPQDMRIVNWACAGPGEETDLDHVPANCHGDALRLQFSFPNCWDGERLDSRDHQSHLAYAWSGDDDRRECPRTHPVPLPTLLLATRWRIDGPLNGVRLASGPPHTAHADFWNTWVQSEMKRLTRECVVEAQNCDRH